MSDIDDYLFGDGPNPDELSSGKRDGHGKFKKGQSGNKRGRPKGIVDKRTTGISASNNVNAKRIATIVSASKNKGGRPKGALGPKAKAEQEALTHEEKVKNLIGSLDLNHEDMGRLLEKNAPQLLKFMITEAASGNEAFTKELFKEISKRDTSNPIAGVREFMDLSVDEIDALLVGLDES